MLNYDQPYQIFRRGVSGHEWPLRLCSKHTQDLLTKSFFLRQYGLLDEGAMSALLDDSLKLILNSRSTLVELTGTSFSTCNFTSVLSLSIILKVCYMHSVYYIFHKILKFRYRLWDMNNNLIFF